MQALLLTIQVVVYIILRRGGTVSNNIQTLIDALKKHFSGQESNLGSALHEYRKSLGLRKLDFCKKLGVKRSAYSSWEYGISKPSVKHGRQLCEALGATIDSIAAISDSEVIDLRAQRKLRGMTQTALAEKIGVSHELISAWECGRSRPSQYMLIQLSKTLGIPVKGIKSKSS